MSSLLASRYAPSQKRYSVSILVADLYLEPFQTLANE